MMKGVTTTLAQIQQRILQYVGPDTFLVGHSLENDLRVMKLVHLKNLDTAVMYPAARVCLRHTCSCTTHLSLADLDITAVMGCGITLLSACGHACNQCMFDSTVADKQLY